MTEKIVPSMDFESHPALMVKCPTCSADIGHKCFMIRSRFQMGDLVHRARLADFIASGRKTEGIILTD